MLYQKMRFSSDFFIFVQHFPEFSCFIIVMTNFAITTSEARSFEESVRILRRYLCRHAIDSLLLGISGGADSVLALRLLAEASREIPGFRLGAAHANFHLRGEESMRDERFVKRIADYYSGEVEFFFRDFDTEDFARQQQISIEMAARQLRHEWWDKLCSRHNFRLIATGHNADDNEETLLLNLLRGASPRGLGGMAPLGNRIFRPLLGLHRSDILRLLTDFDRTHKNLETSERYVVDSTNLESEYRRNFLRNEIIPLLEQRWSGVHTALQTTLRLQTESSAIIDFAIADFLKRHEVNEKKNISYSSLREFPAPASLIFHWLESHGITSTIAREIADHIPSAQSVVEADLHSFRTPPTTFGKRWKLPDGSEILTTPEGLKLTVPDNLTPTGYLTTDSPRPAAKDWTELNTDESILKKLRRATPAEVYLPHPSSEYGWRTPAEADRLRLFPDRKGRRGSKLVSDILREAGIANIDRDKILMLYNLRSGDIVWIPGIRRAGSDLISPADKIIYYLRICTDKK